MPSSACSARATLVPSALAPTTTAVRRDSGLAAWRCRTNLPSAVASHCRIGVAMRPGQQHVVARSSAVLCVAYAHRARMPSRMSQDESDVDRGAEQVVAEAVAPGKGEREDQQADDQRPVAVERAGRRRASRTMNVSTLMPGSSSAATNVVTDCGALKKVRLWGSSNIKRRRDRCSRRHRWRLGKGRGARRARSRAGRAQTTCSCARRPRPNRPSRCASSAASARELTLSLR